MYNLVKGIALGFGLAFSVVTLAAPMAPAHVLLGETFGLILWRPKSLPQQY